MKSLERGLVIIESFDERRRSQMIAEVSEATGIDRAGCRRVLLSLEAAGYVVAEGRRFRLMPRAVRLGGAFLQSAGFADILQPAVEALSRQTGQSCAASVLDGDRARIVARQAGPGFVTIQEQIGTGVPAYCFSMGRILLTTLDPDERRARLTQSERVARTPFTLTSVSDVEERVIQAWRQGFAVIEQELELGLHSIAVPVFNIHGRIVAAINVASQCALTPRSVLLEEHLSGLRGAQESLRALIF